MARPITLTIAGSDSGGGAGIQADLKTFATLGCFGTTVITALTAQNSARVARIDPSSPAAVRAQLLAVLEDFPVRAVKTGMLGSAAIVAEVAALLHTRALPLVVDPVLVASTGDALGGAAVRTALLRQLIPLATLLTPNVPEAITLSGRSIDSRRAMLEAGKMLLALGCRAVLLKGGHLPGPRVHDLYLDGDGAHWFHGPRLRLDPHGTGCALSAAITAELAHGHPLRDAVARGLRFLRRALAHAERVGSRGRAVPDGLPRRRLRASATVEGGAS